LHCCWLLALINNMKRLEAAQRAGGKDVFLHIY
jgi:hypothetical protein